MPQRINEKLVYKSSLRTLLITVRIILNSEVHSIENVNVHYISDNIVKTFDTFEEYSLNITP